MSIYLAAMKNYLRLPPDEEVKKPMVLILVAGATGGAEIGFQMIGEIKNTSHPVVVASQKAISIYGEENLKTLTGAAKIFTGDEFNYDLIKATAFVYLPVVSANLVGKLAHGIYDEALSSIILHAKLAGKTVIGVVDGALANGEGFLRRGFSNPPSGLVRLLNENVKKVLEQEIFLVEAAKIKERLAPYLVNNTATEPNSIKTEKNRREINKRIVTRDDLINLENTAVALPKRAIITDLAREYAAQNNITFIFEN